MGESETHMIKMGIVRVIEVQLGGMRKRLGNVGVLSCELGHECIGIVDSYYDFIDRHVITYCILEAKRLFMYDSWEHGRCVARLYV